MGSYASQLNTKQRWMVIAYIKIKADSRANQQHCSRYGFNSSKK